MQAAPARGRTVRGTTRPSVTAALRAVEALLLEAGQRTARRNAWACVLEDRRRARDRMEAQRVLDQLGTSTSPGTPSAEPRGGASRTP